MRSWRILTRRLVGIVLALQLASLCVAQLRNAADKHGLFVGAAVDITPFNNTSGEPLYRTTLAREYNMLVAENVMKFDALEPAQNQFNFTDADALVAFAQANGMAVRGHNLIWHNQIPAWLQNGNFTRDQLIAIMQNHITTVMKHFAGKVVAWDVVNEAISDNSGNPNPLRTSLWFNGIGPDYITMAFQFARQADPNAKLYYNDYNIEGAGGKPDAAFQLVSGLRSQGLIDGIGWQMHQVNPFTISSANQSNAARLQNLGLELSMTELDIRIQLPDDSTKQQQQATGYGQVVNFCLQQPRCAAIVTWGFTDKFSWIPGTFSGFGDALPFDTNYQPKPAYTAMLSALGGPSVPPAPTNLTASAGNAQVQLNWSASSGATSYNVKQATVSGGPYTLAGTTSGTSFLATGLTNGTTLFFVVSAVNATGESANSNQVSATPQGTTSDFSLSASPASLTVNSGSSGTSTISVTRTGGFPGTVALTATGLPSGVTATLNPASVTGTSSTLTLAAATTATASTSTVTVTGTSGSLSHAATFTLVVTPPTTGTGGVTVTPVVASSSPWFNEEDLKIANTGSLTALSVTIVVQRTTGISFGGEYNTVGGQITQGNSSTISAVTYTFTLNSGQTLGPSSNRTFAAQTSGTGTAHSTAGDTYTVTYTTGGQNFTQTGHF